MTLETLLTMRPPARTKFAWSITMLDLRGDALERLEGARLSLWLLLLMGRAAQTPMIEGVVWRIVLEQDIIMLLAWSGR